MWVTVNNKIFVRNHGVGQSTKQKITSLIKQRMLRCHKICFYIMILMTICGDAFSWLFNKERESSYVVFVDGSEKRNLDIVWSSKERRMETHSQNKDQADDNTIYIGNGVSDNIEESEANNNEMEKKKKRRKPTSNPTQYPTTMPTPWKGTKPNIIFILVDDLAYGNVGFTFTSDEPAENRPSFLSFNTTTTMTRLAFEEGRVMTRHYTAPVCTPTRSAFQSGRLPVHVTQELLGPCYPSSGIPSMMTSIGDIMQRGGYYTSIIGKWDAGMMVKDQIPHGRGYNDSLVYFSHGNWMYTYKLINTDNDNSKIIYTSIPRCDVPGRDGCIIDLWENDAPVKNIQNKIYQEELFAQRVKSTINKVAAMKDRKPLFLVYAPRIGHYPLEAPIEYQNKIKDIVQQNSKFSSEKQDQSITPHRLVYTAMLQYLDDKIKEIVDLLKKNKMWDNTLLVLTSDNGGFINRISPCILKSAGEWACPNGVAGATNFPLRGGKGSFFEGGIRVPTFISGGIIPKRDIGKPIDQLFHIADWYATFAYAAGIEDVTDLKAKSAGLPPVDSINMWNTLFPNQGGNSDNSNTQRTDILLSSGAIISGRYKYLVGSQLGSSWSGPYYPDSTLPFGYDLLSKTIDCASGCLFDVVDDKYERKNLVTARKQLASQLANLLKSTRKSIWQRPNPPKSDICLRNALKLGYLGPWK